MSSLTGVALVTGSSTGIGAACARRLAAEGMTVVVNSARSVAEGEAVASEVGGSYVQADVGVEEEARGLVETAVERHGRLDLVVNNAGTTAVIPHADLDAVTTELWRRILDVNLLGTWHVVRAAVPHLRAAGAGHVVSTSSIAGVRPTGSSIPYAVSKAAVNHLTALLAASLGPEIRVNAVAPGLVDTRWTADWHDVRERVREGAPLRRSPYTTGQVLLVDGGLHLR